MASDEYVLETKGLTKEFKGFFAVRDVDLRIRKGAVNALIGPNGAGKTTVLNLLTKILTTNAGRIYYKGEEITRDGTPDIDTTGQVRSYRISGLLPQPLLTEK